MPQKIKLYRPTPVELGKLFKRKTKCDAPVESKTYTCETYSPIRAVAEYEEMGGVLIAYPGTTAPSDDHSQLPPTAPRTFGVPNDLIILMQQLRTNNPVHIFIMCDDKAEKENIINSLKLTAELGMAFDPDLIHLIPWDTDTYWTRDYSPWWVHYTAREQYGIAKHIYTSLGGGSVGLVEGAEEVKQKGGLGIFRGNDDYGAVKISDFLNAPIRKWNDDKKYPYINPHDWFFTGLLDVGGNYMVTSDGIIASSYLVATQNELPTDDDPEHPSPISIDNRMKYIMEQANRFLGANTYHVLTDPTGTYIGHVDCWGKFLANRKVLIAHSNDTDHPEIEDGLNKIADYFDSVGFEVFRVLCQTMPDPTDPTKTTTAAYTNSLILNKHVYIPMADQKYALNNAQALSIYHEALPDYEIVGVYGKPETPWLGTDALHCRTHGIPRQVVDNWLKSQMLK